MELAIFPIRTVDVKDVPASGKADNKGLENRARAADEKARDDDNGDAFADHMNKDAPAENKKSQASDDAGDERPSGPREAENSRENAPAETPVRASGHAVVEKGKEFFVLPAPVEAAVAPVADAPLNTDALISKDVPAKTHIAANPAVVAETAATPTPVLTASQNVEAPKVSAAVASAPVVKEVETNRAGPVKAATVSAVSSTVQAESKLQNSAPAVQISGAAPAQGDIILDGVAPVEEEVLPKDLIKADLPGLRVAAPGKTMTPTASSIIAAGPVQTAASSLAETAPESSSQIFAQEGASARLFSLQPSQVATSAMQASTAAVASTASAQLVAAIRAEPKNGDIEVRLDPPELGRVRINLSIETADAVKAVLTVERPETLEHLRRNMSQFTDDLRMAGFESIDVEFSEGGGSDFEDESAWAGTEPGFAASAEIAPSDVIYLSMRENAQLDLLV